MAWLCAMLQLTKPQSFIFEKIQVGIEYSMNKVYIYLAYIISVNFALIPLMHFFFGITEIYCIRKENHFI